MIKINMMSADASVDGLLYLDCTVVLNSCRMGLFSIDSMYVLMFASTSIIALGRSSTYVLQRKKKIDGILDRTQEFGEVLIKRFESRLSVGR